MITVRGGIRFYTCSTCGAEAEWDAGWRWRSADSYYNGQRYLVLTCSDECRNAVPFLTIKEFAREHGAHPNTIWVAIARGRIAAKKVEGKWRISAATPFSLRPYAKRRAA